MVRHARSVFLIGAILSLAYFTVPNVYTKPLPIWCLSAVAFSSGTSYGQLIGLGLLFSSAGDVFLELDSQSADADLFVPGLVAFLVAHLIYITAFYRSNLDYKHATAIAVPVAMYYFSIMGVLLPELPHVLVVPVLIYGLAISVMALLAILRSFSDQTCGRTSRYCSLIGSLVFVLSDSILAINKFAFPIQNAHFYVMVTYYFGQTYLAASTLHSAATKKQVKGDSTYSSRLSG